MHTEAELKEAANAGICGANAALAQSDKPLLIMDEYCQDELATAYAIGWNSVWACDENRRRWADYKDNGDEKTPPHVVGALVKLMSTVDDRQMWRDRLIEVTATSGEKA